MKTDTKNQIITLLQKKGPQGPSSIAASLQISPQMAHRHLKNLQLTGDIRKQGAPPKVLYIAVDKHPPYPFPVLPD